MMNLSIIKLLRMIQQNFILCALICCMSSQSQMLLASKPPAVQSARQPAPPKPSKLISANVQRPSASSSSNKFDVDDIPSQTSTSSSNSSLSSVSLPKIGINSAGKQTKPTVPANQTMVSRAKSAAQAIAQPFVDALQYADSATGISAVCATYIAKPVQAAWVKARKLQVDSNNTVLRKNGELDFNTPSASGGQGQSDSIERGLLNKKIDNIVNSVTNMYKNNVSREQIGKFVSNSVELLLATPVVAAGGGAGVMIAGLGGAAVGGIGLTAAVVGGTGGMILATGPAVVGVAAIGATAGGVYGAYHGAGAGARYTSQFIQSPRKAWSSMKSDSLSAQESAKNTYNKNFRTSTNNAAKAPTNVTNSLAMNGS